MAIVQKKGLYLADSTGADVSSKVAIFTLDGGGNPTGLATLGGVAVSGAAPSYTWATKPAVAAGNKNKYIVITDLIETGGIATLFQSDGASTWQQQTIPRTTFAKAFASSNLKGTAGHRVICTDIGLGGGIELVSDGTNLRPATPSLLFKQRYGTYAAPTLTKTGVNSWIFPLSPVLSLPANLFYDGAAMEFRAIFRKHTATATARAVIYLGTAGDATDSLIFQTSITNADGQQALAHPWVEFTGTTTAISSSATVENNQSNTGALTLSTQLNTAAAMIPSFGFDSANIADTIDLVSVSCLWRY